MIYPPALVVVLTVVSADNVLCPVSISGVPHRFSLSPHPIHIRSISWG